MPELHAIEAVNNAPTAYNATSVERSCRNGLPVFGPMNETQTIGRLAKHREWLIYRAAVTAARVQS